MANRNDGAHRQVVVVIEDDDQLAATTTGRNSPCNSPAVTRSSCLSPPPTNFMSRNAQPQPSVAGTPPHTQTSSARALRTLTWDFSSSVSLPAMPSLEGSSSSPAAKPNFEHRSNTTALASRLSYTSQGAASSTSRANNHYHKLVDSDRIRRRTPFASRPWARPHSPQAIQVDDNTEDSSTYPSDLTFVFDQMSGTTTPTVGSKTTSDVRDMFLSDRDFNTGLSHQVIEERHRTKSRSIPSPQPSKVILKSCTHNGDVICTNRTVEFADGDFMRIKEVLQDPTSKEVFLSGWIFRRMMYMNGTVEKKLNEVCWIIHVDKSDGRSITEQGIQEISLTQVVRKRGLKLTNQPFPALRWSEQSSRPDTADRCRDYGVLICRWKYICTYANATSLKKNVHIEKALVRLRQEECDAKIGVPDGDLRKQSRGQTVLGGASVSMGIEEAKHREEERRIAQIGRDMLSKADRASAQGSGITNLSSTIGSVASKPIEIDSAFIINTTTRGRHSNHAISAANDTPLKSNANLKQGRRRSTSQCGMRSVRPKIRMDLTEDHAWSVNRGRNLEKQSAKQGHQTQNSVMNRTRGYHEDIAWKTPPRCPSLIILSPPNALQNAKLSDSSLDSRQPLRTDSVSTFGKEHSHSVINLEEDACGQPSVPKLQGNAVYRSHEKHVGICVKAAPPPYMQRYTFGDGFCGCGGVSRGAAMAGFRIEWAFDFEDAMCKSYHGNFPTTNLSNKSAFDFAASCRLGYQIDVLHLSPPCQFFSPAHTTEGQHDEQNTASSFVIAELLKNLRPRIVTLENTLGLEQRHPLYLHAVIQQFTALGYSIRWKIMDLRDFGVPQSRRRLILMAACPGETLPEFPEPTHSSDRIGTKLKPWTTINGCISTIPTPWPNHDVEFATAANQRPFDGNTQAKCITCSGGVNNFHPSGRRRYTIRELASLQTFPLEHRFAMLNQTWLRKQIGNSVPPTFYKCLAENIIQALRKADGLSSVEDEITSPQGIACTESQARSNTNSHAQPSGVRNSTTSLSKGVEYMVID